MKQFSGVREVTDSDITVVFLLNMIILVHCRSHRLKYDSKEVCLLLTCLKNEMESQTDQYLLNLRRTLKHCLSTVYSSMRCLTPYNKSILGKPIIPKPVKTFLEFCGIRRFVVVFTRTNYLSSSAITCVQSTPSNFTPLKSIFPSKTRFSKRSFSFRFPH